MKFNVYCASNSWSESKPCKEAKLGKSYKTKFGDMVYVYEVELNSLEDLIELLKSVGHPLIIQDTIYLRSDNEFDIQIYDDYIE